MIVVAYVYITFFAGYPRGLRVQMRIFTGHPMVFYGICGAPREEGTLSLRGSPWDRGVR